MLKRVTSLFAAAGLLASLTALPILAQDKMDDKKMDSKMSGHKMTGHTKMTGKKMTQRESVVEITANPISPVASDAACRGVTPFSST